MPEAFLESGHASRYCRLFLAHGELQAALLTVSHQTSPVEAEFVDVKCSGVAESREHAIWLLDDVLCEVVQ
jgi:hypothetical protein